MKMPRLEVYIPGQMLLGNETGMHLAPPDPSSVACPALSSSFTGAGLLWAGCRLVGALSPHLALQTGSDGSQWSNSVAEVFTVSRFLPAEPCHQHCRICQGNLTSQQSPT